MRRTPAVPLALGLSTGIALGIIGIGWWIVGILLTCCIVLFVKRRTIAGYTLAAVSMGWILAWAQSIPSSHSLPLVEASKGEFAAVVNSYSEISTGSVRLSADIVAKADSTSRFAPTQPTPCVIYLPGAASFDIAEGDTLLFRAQLRQGSKFPGLGQESFLQTTIYSSDDLILHARQRSALDNFIANARRDIFNAIVTSPVHSETSAFLVALILGDKSLTDNANVQTFRRAGLGHILAVSGLHVGILVMLLQLVLWPVRCWRYHRLSRWLIIAFVWVYALITNMSPSVTRAAVMCTALILGTLLQRRVSPYNSLALAVIAILLADPLALASPGFQMSVSAVVSILYFTPRLIPVAPRRHILYSVCQYIAVPIAAMIGVSVIAAYWFGTLPISGILANAVASLLLLPFMSCALLCIILTAMHLPWELLGNIVDTLYNTIHYIASIFSGKGFWGLTDFHPDFITITAYFIAVVCFGIWLERRRPIYVFASATALCVMVTSIFATDKPVQDGIYITSNQGNTDIVVVNNAKPLLITTSDSVASATWLKRRKSQYAYQMPLCNTDSLQVVKVSDSIHLPELVMSNKFIATPHASLFVVDNDSIVLMPPLKPRYMLVCKGFKGDICSLAKAVNPDTALLSADINNQRATRYSHQLSELGIPNINLNNRSSFRINY